MLWGGYTAKILISGTAKYEQYCNVTWFMGPTEAPCSLCGVVSCLVTVETVNHFIFQICKIQVSCLTWLRALFSPLLLRLQKIAGDTDVDSLEAGRSWTQSPSFADRFGIAVLTCSSAQAGVRGRRSSTESGLCVNQQSSNVLWNRASLGLHTLNEHLSCSQSIDKQSGHGQAQSSYSFTTSQQWKRAMELFVHVNVLLWFHTFLIFDKYL